MINEMIIEKCRCSALKFPAFSPSPVIYPKFIQVYSFSVTANVLISWCNPGLWNGHATAEGPVRATHNLQLLRLLLIPRYGFALPQQHPHGNSNLELGQLL